MAANVLPHLNWRIRLEKVFLVPLTAGYIARFKKDAGYPAISSIHASPYRERQKPIAQIVVSGPRSIAFAA